MYEYNERKKKNLVINFGDCCVAVLDCFRFRRKKSANTHTYQKKKKCREIVKTVYNFFPRTLFTQIQMSLNFFFIYIFYNVFLMGNGHRTIVQTTALFNAADLTKKVTVFWQDTGDGVCVKKKNKKSISLLIKYVNEKNFIFRLTSQYLIYILV